MIHKYDVFCIERLIIHKHSSPVRLVSPILVHIFWCSGAKICFVGISESFFSVETYFIAIFASFTEIGALYNSGASANASNRSRLDVQPTFHQQSSSRKHPWQVSLSLCLRAEFCCFGSQVGAFCVCWWDRMILPSDFRSRLSLSSIFVHRHIFNLLEDTPKIIYNLTTLNYSQKSIDKETENDFRKCDLIKLYVLISMKVKPLLDFFMIYFESKIFCENLYSPYVPGGNINGPVNYPRDYSKIFHDSYSAGLFY